MKKILPLMAMLGLGTVSVSNLSPLHNLFGQSSMANQTINQTTQEFLEGVTVISESRDADFKPNTTVEFNFTISLTHLKAIANQQITPKTFLDNLQFVDHFGTKINDPHYQIAVKKELSNILTDEINQLIIHSSDQGVIAKIKSVTPWDDQIFNFEQEGFFPYVNYQPTEELANYDKVEKWFRAFSADQLKLDISEETWQQMVFLLTDHNYQADYNQMLSMFPQEDHSGVGGSITASDLKTLVHVLLDNWDDINKQFDSTLAARTGWQIIVDTDGTYIGTDSE